MEHERGTAFPANGSPGAGSGLVILLVTFGLTVFVDLVVAVNIGVILAALLFMRRMASSVEVQEQTTEQLREEFGHRGLTFPPGVLVYRVEGPFFFGAVENFERALASTHTDPEVVILRLRWVPFMDITGSQTLEDREGPAASQGTRDDHRRERAGKWQAGKSRASRPPGSRELLQGPAARAERSCGKV